MRSSAFTLAADLERLSKKEAHQNIRMTLVEAASSIRLLSERVHELHDMLEAKRGENLALEAENRRIWDAFDKVCQECAERHLGRRHVAPTHYGGPLPTQDGDD
jgi:hypothetical protein